MRLKSIFYFIFLRIKNIIVDPAFRLMHSPLDGELDFYLKNDFYWLFENDLESPLIFVLFLKG